MFMSEEEYSNVYRRARAPLYSSMSVHGFGALQPGVDYHHPAGLRFRYAFTKAANKAPIPTEKPPAGMWWVLQRLPTGVWYYDLQKKPEEAPAATEKKADTTKPSTTTQPTAPTSVIKPSTPLARRRAGASNVWTYAAIGAGALAVIGAAAFALSKRR